VRGFTLVELVVVVAIIAVVSALALPATGRWLSHQRLKASARTVEAALANARGEAQRSGNIHVVFFRADVGGNPLLDTLGNAVPILVLDDGRPGAAGQNCVIDAGETTVTYELDSGIAFGATQAPAPAPSDPGVGDFASGITFTPLPFDAACATGPVGSGGGAVYLSDGNRDLAVVLTPLGGSRAHAWDTANAAWTR
jgi:prepilin-type N-terminal cleavage/methylation domain-containing protein